MIKVVVAVPWRVKEDSPRRIKFFRFKTTVSPGAPVIVILSSPFRFADVLGRLGVRPKACATSAFAQVDPNRTMVARNDKTDFWR